MLTEVIMNENITAFVLTKTNRFTFQFVLILTSLYCLPELYLSLHYQWNMNHLTFFKRVFFLLNVWYGWLWICN